MRTELTNISDLLLHKYYIKYRWKYQYNEVYLKRQVILEKEEDSKTAVNRPDEDNCDGRTF